MKVIAALGNPGDKYRNNRHNIGFMIADYFASKFNVAFKFDSKFNSEIGNFNYNNEKIFILKPQTYMNLSGNAIREFVNYYNLKPKDLLLIYDDISINLGTLRFREKGSDGGHNGIKSVIYNLNTDTFDRLKVGIGPQPPLLASEAFVLQNFSKKEQELLATAINKSMDAITIYLAEGINNAQNKFN